MDTPQPQLVGTLTTADGLWCVGGVAVDLGPDLGVTAAEDYNGDDKKQSLLEELTALLGAQVVVEWEAGTDPRKVLRLNDLPY